MTDQQTSRTNITEALREALADQALYIEDDDGNEVAYDAVAERLADALAAEPRSDALTAHAAYHREEPCDCEPQPDEPSGWKELIAAGRASGIETAPDEPSTGLDVGRLVRQWESHAHFLEDAADATADRKHAAALRGEARGVDWARRILFARYSIEREAGAASASVPPFGASKANPFTKKIDVVADTPEQGK